MALLVASVCTGKLSAIWMLIIGELCRLHTPGLPGSSRSSRSCCQRLLAGSCEPSERACVPLCPQLSSSWPGQPFPKPRFCAGGCFGLANYYENMLRLSNAIALWLGIQPPDLFFYAFLPPLLVDAALRMDFYIFKKVGQEGLLEEEKAVTGVCRQGTDAAARLP